MRVTKMTGTMMVMTILPFPTPSLRKIRVEENKLIILVISNDF